MRFLDNVLTDFIENAPEQFNDATYSAMKERSVGLGVMGLHSFFQQKNIPLEYVMSKVWYKKIFGEGFFYFFIFSRDIRLKWPILGHFDVRDVKIGQKSAKTQNIKKSFPKYFFTP